MITSYKFIGISHEIKSNGEIETCNNWIVTSDCNNNHEAYQDALNWSGKVGDFFRLPHNRDSSNYEFDSSCRVHEILIKSCEDLLTFQVTFLNYTSKINDDNSTNGHFFDPENPQEIIAISQKHEVTTNEFGNEETTFFREYYGDYRSLNIPAQGEIIVYNQDNYFCKSVKIKQEADYKFSLTIAAIKSNTEAKLINESTDNANRTKNFKYFVNLPDVNNFIQSFEIDKTSEICGEDYYLQSIQKINNDTSGAIIELFFRKIKTEIIEYSREERLADFCKGEIPNPEVFFKSTWQVHADDLYRFYNITGNSASDWAEPNSIITRVIPKKISNLEYQIQIEAELLSNPSLYKSYSNSSHYSLSGRIDYKVQWVDFKLTPTQCGYTLTQNAQFFPIDNWDSTFQCPIITNGILSPTLINSISKLVQITEITYKRGNIKSNIASLITWHSPRVIYEKIANYKGSYLKTNLSTSEVIDNFGKKWTMITRTYLLAPIGHYWNESYWENKL